MMRASQGGGEPASTCCRSARIACASPPCGYAGLDHLGRRRAADGHHAQQLAIIELCRTVGVLVDALAVGAGAAHVDQAQLVRSHLVDQKAQAAAEVAIQVFFAVGGDGDTDRTGHVARLVRHRLRQIRIVDHGRGLAP
jgi:hypothetical protein